MQCLQEECAEVIHVASKCVRFGSYDVHPKTNEINKDMLIEEIKDLYHKVEKLQELGILPNIELSHEDRSYRDDRFYKFKAIADNR